VQRAACGEMGGASLPLQVRQVWGAQGLRTENTAVTGSESSDVCFGNAHQSLAIAHHQATRLDANDVLALHGLEFLVDPLA